MVLIDIEMPDRCANCPINFWNSCRILEYYRKTSGRIENPSDKRLENCPLISIQNIKDMLK